MRCWLGLNNENPTQRREDEESAKGYEDKGRARNNFRILHLIFSPSLPVLQSQNLKIERLFLRFCSIRTNKYELNLSAIFATCFMHVPCEKKSQMLWISALFASSRLCVGFYDLVTRGRGTARSIEYKAMILFG